MYFQEFRHVLKNQQKDKDRYGDKRCLDDLDKNARSSSSPVVNTPSKRASADAVACP
jgi:hypothetical protein